MRDSIVDEFREFYDGKQGLLDLRRQHPPDDIAIAKLIAKNGEIRRRFSKVIEEVGVTYRDKMLGGQPNDAFEPMRTAESN